MKLWKVEWLSYIDHLWRACLVLAPSRDEAISAAEKTYPEVREPASMSAVNAYEIESRVISGIGASQEIDEAIFQLSLGYKRIG